MGSPGALSRRGPIGITLRHGEHMLPKRGEPGYGVIRIKSHVLGDLTHASASIKTIRGIVSSEWKKTADSLYVA